MLKTSLIAMTLLGCDCDAKQCEYIADAPGQWSTLAECEASMKRAVLGSSALDYPLVTGLCRTVETGIVAVSDPAENGPVELAGVQNAQEAGQVTGQGASPATGQQSSMVFRLTSGGYQTALSGLSYARETLVSRSLAAAESVAPVMSRIGGLLPSF